MTMYFIPTDDSVRIAARHYPPTTPPSAKAAVIIASAMGVPQEFYKGFAEWLATQGFAAYTFDYRGTGASRPAGSLRGFKANIDDWAQLDCAAVIDHVSAAHPDLPIFWIGHSVGAQIFGMIPNHTRLTAMLSVAAGSGYHRHNATPLRYYAPVLWYTIAPLSLLAAGYFPGKKLRMIGDLPHGVMKQWRKWCLSADYLGSEGLQLREQLANVRVPITAWSMRDDEMMTLAGTQALFSLYSGTQLEIVRMDPACYGVDRIGHFGLFRSQSRDALWPLVSSWLTKQLSAQQPFSSQVSHTRDVQVPHTAST